MRIKNICLLACMISVFLSNGQDKSKISLWELDTVLLKEFKEQGKKLFKKSDCFEYRQAYSIVPYFNVESIISLDSLGFDKIDVLQKNLYFLRKSRRKLLNEIKWEVINDSSRSYVASSDWKQFYCYKTAFEPLDYIYESIKRIGLQNISYFFYIKGTDGFLMFIVDKKGCIYVHHSQKSFWLTLKEFNSYYVGGKIERLSDNPFKE